MPVQRWRRLLRRRCSLLVYLFYQTKGGGKKKKKKKNLHDGGDFGKREVIFKEVTQRLSVEHLDVR